MIKKICVLTSGGDSPGMNACIRAVVRTAIWNGLEAEGAIGGFSGLVGGNFMSLDSRSVSNVMQRGGTILKAGRCPEFQKKKFRKIAYDNMVKRGIGGLVVIGGDGSFRGAELLCLEHRFQVVGVPGTIDNDIYGSDTVGFDTAVNTALSAIDKIKDTSISHGLPFFIEVMGRKSGFLALESSIAGGAEAALLPEVLHDFRDVKGAIVECRKKGKRSLIVIVAEGDESGGAKAAGERIRKATGIDYRTCVLGHIQRGGSPTARDRVLASRLGFRAVNELLRGTSGMMVGELEGKPTLIPLRDTWGKKKGIDVQDLEMVRAFSI